MLKLYSTGCPKCKVLKKKLQDSGREFEVIEDIIKVNEFAEKHDIYEAPFLVTDSEEILNFREAIKYLS